MIIDVTTKTDGKSPVLFVCNSDDVKNGYAVYFTLDPKIPVEEHKKILKNLLNSECEELKNPSIGERINHKMIYSNNSLG